MTTKSKDEPRLSRDAWLEHALSILREEGIQGVRVERLARDMGVTKGSFYWHFADRNELFESLLKFWTRQYNDVVTKNSQFLKGEPASGLLAAMTKVRHEGLDKYELAMRAWADHDSQAQSVVQAVYQQRKLFVKGFFTRMDFRGMDAEVRTRLTLCYLSWEPSMYEDESDSRRLSLLKRLQELLMTR